MSQFFQIHPENPQQRLINQAVEIIRNGGVIIYPTDSGYALGCGMGEKRALEVIRRIRKVDSKHNFTLVCKEFSELSNFAKINNSHYRLIKGVTPGAYTFILEATREVPRRLMHEKKKTIGIRLPDNLIALALVETLGEPIMSSTLILPGETIPMTDPYEMRQLLEHEVDLIIDGGYCGFESTSVIDLTGELPVVVRAGQGDTSLFE